jgi:hypothetical protein
MQRSVNSWFQENNKKEAKRIPKWMDGWLDGWMAGWDENNFRHVAAHGDSPA